MSFIGDRYEIMASWILNPRQMWRGRDLEQYLEDTVWPRLDDIIADSHRNREPEAMLV